MGLFNRKNEGKCEGKANNDAYVKILGTGCLKCKQLESNAKEAIKLSGKNFEVSHVTDINEIARYGVMVTPALVIGNDVVSVGKVLSTQEIMELINRGEKK
jgi:small redox-active disulfide protein 2